MLGKLNILFGRNGAAKSTIAKAVNLFSQGGEQLLELAPYGDSELTPSIDGIPTVKIAIFNDDYVKQYVYQEDSIVKKRF